MVFTRRYLSPPIPSLSLALAKSLHKSLNPLSPLIHQSPRDLNRSFQSPLFNASILELQPEAAACEAKGRAGHLAGAEAKGIPHGRVRRVRGEGPAHVSFDE